MCIEGRYGTATLHSVERHKAVQVPTAATPSHGLRVYEHIMATPRHPHSRHPRLNKDLLSDWQETAHMTTVPAPPVALAVLMVVRDAN